MPILEAGSRVDFLTRQVVTSRNIRGGFFMDTLMGGLNRQVEHHLFPDMARPELRRANALVLAVCARERHCLYRDRAAGVLRHSGGLPEPCGPVSAADPFDCPLVRQFR